MTNPTWWKEPHESAWTRVKDALKRDWEQTKNDLSRDAGQDLGQTAGKTVKEALGKEPHGKDAKWDEVEHAHRFGVGARRQYPKWDDKAMADEWTSLKDGRKWEDVAPHVKRGFEYDV